MSVGDRTRRGWPRVAAIAWVGLWWGLLVLCVAPWADLGGLVDERLRWLHRCGWLGGATVGYVCGEHIASGERPRAPALRLLLYPPATLAAAGLALLQWRGLGAAVAALLSALVAYQAGAWTAVCTARTRPAPPVPGSEPSHGAPDAEAGAPPGHPASRR